MSPDDDSKPPTEFTSFVRRIGIDSFDRFAHKRLEKKSSAKGSNPLQSLANLWVGLTPDEKERFFDQVIAAGQAAAVAAPAILAMAKLKTAKKAAKDNAPATAEEAEQQKEKKGKKKKTGKNADEKSEEKKDKKRGKKDRNKDKT